MCASGSASVARPSQDELAVAGDGVTETMEATLVANRAARRTLINPPCPAYFSPSPHLPPGQRLLSSQTYSYRPAASHSGLATIWNSCDHGAVKIFGSSIVSSYDSVSLPFHLTRSIVWRASLCIRYSFELV